MTGKIEGDFNNGSPWGSGNGGNGSGGGGKKPGSPWGGGNKPQRPPRPRQGTSAQDIEKAVENIKAKFGGGNRGSGGPGGAKAGKGIPLPFILLVALIAFLLFTSVFTVDQQEEAVVLRFGEYKRTVGPGLNFKFPSPIETKMIRKTREVQKIDSEKGVSSLMLTGDENIIDIEYTVLWRINNLENFLFEVDDPRNAVAAVSQSAMREIVGKSELQKIYTTDRLKVSTATRDLMQTTLDEYGAGVEIVEVQLQKADPPSQGGVVDAFRDVVNADQDAETLVNQATAIQNDIVPKARGEAAQILQDAEAYAGKVVAEAEGKAQRFVLVYDEYKAAPRVTRERLYLETLEELYQNGQVVVLDSDSGSGVVPFLPLNEFTRPKGQ